MTCQHGLNREIVDCLQCEADWKLDPAPQYYDEVVRLRSINAELCAAIRTLDQALIPVGIALNPTGQDAWPEIAQALIKARAALKDAQ